MMRSLRGAQALLVLSSFAGWVGAVEVELHGSGTTNPSKFFWKIMETFRASSKDELHMTYRAVGSGTGQKEFVGQSPGYAQLSNFGSGDIPMSKANYDLITGASRSMVHVPFCLGAIGIFHSIPPAEVGTDGLKLSACLLAKIFSGAITTWDDAAIKVDNPNLKIPAGTVIKVGHRTLGSSSTGGLAGYLDKTCPSGWSLTDSSTINWPSKDSFTSVLGSPGMVSHIASTKYAIGYLDAGHGHQRDFEEVKLKNQAQKWLTSKQALEAKDANGNNGVAAAGAAAVAAGVIPATSDSDWSAVNLFDQTSGNDVWPIVLVSYFYISKNIGSMTAQQAGLLKAFVDYVVGAHGQAMLPDFSFNAIPTAMNKWSTVWASLTKPSTVTTFTYEEATAAYSGQGFSVISPYRNSYSMWMLSEMEGTLAAMESRLVALESHIGDYGIVALHGSGTTNPKTWFAKAMKNMESQARAPLLLTYRAVGSSTGMAEFVGQQSNGFKSYNHFGAGDIPMTQSLYNALPAGEEMVHIPFALGAIGIFHSVPGADISLDACLLADIFMGNVKTWDDAKIKAQNPSLTVPAGQKITVGHRTLGSSSTGGFSGYLKKKCPSVFTKAAGATVAWPTYDNFKAIEGSPGMQALIADNSYVIGYLDSGHGHDLDLSEIKLKNAAGISQTSLTSIAKGGVATAGSQGISDGVFPADHSDDWSAVDLYDMAGADTWPIVLVSYFYVKKDQTETSPKAAAALKAFVTMILDNAGNLCEEFGFTGLSKAMKDKSVNALSTVVFPVGMTEFTFETATDTYNGMGANVISSKRFAYDDYHRDQIDGAVTKLETAVSGLSGTGVIPLHGSGTTNPKTWFAKAMKMMEDRARLPLFLSYRAVGSSTGMSEFVGADNGFKSYNHFGCGDIPMDSVSFNQLPDSEQMVHIPFALGAVGIFHSVPGEEISLDACLLASIYMGLVTTWDDSKIKALNPNIKVPAGTKIIVGHRTLGSSSTGGFSGYLAKKCPNVFTKKDGATVDWPKTSGFKPVEGSPGMQQLIAGTKYAIGYLDAGHGHDLDLSEIKLKNKAGTSQSSKVSIAKGGVAMAGTQGVQKGIFPSTPDSDWSAVNLYDMDGQDTWPIVLVSYFYVKKDQRATSPATAAALKGFVTMILNNNDKLCEEFGFTAPSETLYNMAFAALAAVSFPSSMKDLTFESSTMAGAGMGENVISVKRYAYDDYQREDLARQVSVLQEKLQILQVHKFSISGTMDIVVDDANSFVLNEAAKKGVAEGIAAKAGVSVDAVAVKLEAAQATSRRLHAEERRLSGTVKVSYTIISADLDAIQGASKSDLESSIRTGLSNQGLSAEASSMTVKTNSMDAADSSKGGGDSLSVAAIVVSVVAILFSTCSSCLAFQAMRSSKTNGYAKEGQMIGASSA